MKSSKKIIQTEAPEAVGVLLRRLTALWRRKLNSALSAIELTDMQFVLIRAVAWKSEMGEVITQVQLTEESKVSRAVASQTLLSLERKKLVRRKPAADQRTLLVLLTPAGQRKTALGVRILEETEREFWKDIPDLALSLKEDLQAILAHYADEIEGGYSDLEGSAIP